MASPATPSLSLGSSCMLHLLRPAPGLSLHVRSHVSIGCAASQPATMCMADTGPERLASMW
jgi:hypothetical protein